ncbi:hypothetical protein ACFUJT_07705 [Streptomyces griseoincarnatus]
MTSGPYLGRRHCSGIGRLPVLPVVANRFNAGQHGSNGRIDSALLLDPPLYGPHLDQQDGADGEERPARQGSDDLSGIRHT